MLKYILTLLTFLFSVSPALSQVHGYDPGQKVEATFVCASEKVILKLSEADEIGKGEGFQLFKVFVTNNLCMSAARGHGGIPGTVTKVLKTYVDYEEKIVQVIEFSFEGILVYTMLYADTADDYKNTAGQPT